MFGVKLFIVIKVKFKSIDVASLHHLNALLIAKDCI